MPIVRSLLVLGFNVSLQKPTPSMNITKTMNIIRYDMRRFLYFKNQMEEKEEEEEGWYIRGIYIKSDWEPPLSSKEVECKLDNSEKELPPWISLTLDMLGLT